MEARRVPLETEEARRGDGVNREKKEEDLGSSGRRRNPRDAAQAPWL